MCVALRNKSVTRKDPFDVALTIKGTASVLYAYRNPEFSVTSVTTLLLLSSKTNCYLCINLCDIPFSSRESLSKSKLINAFEQLTLLLFPAAIYTHNRPKSVLSYAGISLELY